MWVAELYPCQAQQVDVQAGFLKDSVSIGEPVHYYLTARYASELNVFFPDSMYTFSPFEFIRKTYVQTTSANGASYDSAVYEVQTFEIEPLQWLSLPVFVVAKQDCLRYESVADTLRLRSLVSELPPDTVAVTQLPLKTATDYQWVNLLFNYPILAIVVVSILFLGIVAWFIFGKRIRRYFTVKRLTGDYQRFQLNFTACLTQLDHSFSVQVTERAVSLWKKYLEHLESKPFTKLTTRETVQMEKDEQLGKMLKLIDGALYGNNVSVHEPLQYLGTLAGQRFQQKVEGITHGGNR
jgi:hypothetical protein